MPHYISLANTVVLTSYTNRHVAYFFRQMVQTTVPIPRQVMFRRTAIGCRKYRSMEFSVNEEFASPLRAREEANILSSNDAC
jgi:hypothetical protein